MRHKNKFRYTRIALGVFALLFVGSIPAHAVMIITVGNATVFQGGSSSLDVTLTNTGGISQNIAGFSFQITVPGGSGITFTSVNISTANTYIFNGDSLDGPTISAGTPNPGPGPIIDGIDFSNSGLGTNVAAAQTLGLGHVLFNASALALPGPVTVTLDITGCPTNCGVTSLSDSLGNNVSFTGVNGTITILANTVPEPSTLLLVLLALPALAAARRRLR